jgi:hypothetical protein
LEAGTDWDQNVSAAIGFIGHKDIAGKASHCFEKASIRLKMYLIRNAILEKASISKVFENT